MKKPTLLEIAIRGTLGTIVGVISSFFVGMLIWGLMNLGGIIAKQEISAGMLIPILTACMAIGSIIGLAVGIQDAKDNPPASN